MNVSKNLGAKMVFTGGREPATLIAEVKQSNHWESCPGDKAVMIREYDSEKGIEVSIETLGAILAWAKES